MPPPGTFLALLYGGGIAAKYYDHSNAEFSRDLISAEIHLLSANLAFAAGLRSGLLHFLGCGIVPRRFNWTPHYLQIYSVSQTLAASFASGNSEVPGNTVLYFLSLCYISATVNEYLASIWNHSPKWMRMHSLYHTAGALGEYYWDYGQDATLNFMSSMDPDVDISKWKIIYPTYLDKSMSVSGGRRVKKEIAVLNPTVEEIQMVCEHLKVPCKVEETKCYPRNWLVQGRVRVLLEPPQTKSMLLNEISTLIPQLKSRQQPAVTNKKSTSSGAVAGTKVKSKKKKR
ncbi:bifunctional Signal recognition particle [Babesia duncani]|uniref:Bifunctional Signal recognition particle n=1 Tax=Babesia duncani TaxID=323732 RepID=A0AAD9PLL7_9APIC|nr:bifunctional Signal recognition particle [Babesia duncani]